MPSVHCLRAEGWLIWCLSHGENEMGRGVTVLLTVAMILTASLAGAQDNSASTPSDRKVATRVAPVYPELAKKMHIHGVVRVEAIVRPNGSVKNTRVLGGSPVLVDAAADAVAKWKFVASQGETTEVVQLVFNAE
ncbi:MAG TPA: TonB family protein [Candidatus Sulfotelmatobacter sp.]